MRVLLFLGIFIFCIAESSELRASPRCKSGLIAVALVSTSLSNAYAGIATSSPSWQSREVAVTRWPFKNLNATPSITSGASLPIQIQEAHDRFENFVFYEGLSSVYDQSFYPQDRWLNPNTGPHWLAIDGGWKTILLVAPSQMPFDHAFGTQVFYDLTPHTPGLYQFTTVDWSNWPFNIKVTHFAWSLDTRMPWEQNFDTSIYSSSSSIPAPSSLIPLAGLSAWMNRRKR